MISTKQAFTWKGVAWIQSWNISDYLSEMSATIRTAKLQAMAMVSKICDIVSVIILFI